MALAVRVDPPTQLGHPQFDPVVRQLREHELELATRERPLRRGVPFIELRPDGVLDAGLQFVSFQASMEQFVTISDEWMSNTDFPEPGTGADALFARGFATVTHLRALIPPTEPSLERG